MACKDVGKVAIHTVTCKRDMYMTLFSLKSLLRYEDNVSVVLHGDDSLDEECADIFRKHIPGCVIWFYEDAKNEIKSSYPELYELRQKMRDRYRLDGEYIKQRRAWALKLFDTHIFAPTDRIIMLDSDILFLQRPDQLIEWINDENAPAFYTVPEKPNLKIAEKAFRRVFPNVPVFDRFNSGLIGFSNKKLSLELKKEVGEKIIANDDIHIYGDECFWRCAIAHVDHEMLPFEKYTLIEDREQFRRLVKNKRDLVCYVHFLLKHQHGVYRKLADEVYAELKLL